jgi:hypothetical protein
VPAPVPGFEQTMTGPVKAAPTGGLRPALTDPSHCRTPNLAYDAVCGCCVTGCAPAILTRGRLGVAIEGVGPLRSQEDDTPSSYDVVVSSKEVRK